MDWVRHASRNPVGHQRLLLLRCTTSDIGSCLYYACNAELTALTCSSAMNPYKATGIAGLFKKLSFPQCYVDYVGQTLGSAGGSVDFYGNCQQFQVGVQRKACIENKSLTQDTALCDGVGHRARVVVRSDQSRAAEVEQLQL